MRLFVTLIPAVVVALALGCVSHSNPQCGDGSSLCGVNGTEVTTLSTPGSREQCEALGGIWGRIGLMPAERCNLPTRDVGKACSGQGDCEGACLADLTEDEREKTATGVLYKNGSCTAWRIVTGCHAMVEDGKVMGVICLD